MNMKRQSSSLYFINAPVDVFFMGGASILTFLGLWWFDLPQRTPIMISISTSLLWMINWPHFSMTSYRLYQSPYHLRQYPFTAFVMPFLLLALAISAFQAPQSIAPYLIKLLLIWSPYHFSGQTVGLTLVYARRAGIAIGKWERLALSAFVFGTFVLSTLQAEVSRVGSQFYGIAYPGFTYMLLERRHNPSVSRLPSGFQALRHHLEPVVSRL
jgi:hypothetical protein